MELNEELRLTDIESEFISYLKDTNSIKYLSLSETSGDFYGAKKLPYIHRWTKVYQSKFYYRLHLLETWFLWKNTEVSFMTVTTGRNWTHENQILTLKNGFQRIIKEMRREGCFLEYLASMDFHKDGFGHYHVIFFGKMDEEFKKYIKNQWENWEYGSKKHGIDFRSRQPGEVQHLVRYLFKHAGKIFTGIDKPGWLRFHSVIWKMYHSKEDLECPYQFPGIRLFSMSKEISKIMKVPISDHEVIRVVQVGKGSVWDKDTWTDEERIERKRKIKEYVDFFTSLTI